MQFRQEKFINYIFLTVYALYRIASIKTQSALKGSVLVHLRKDTSLQCDIFCLNHLELVKFGRTVTGLPHTKIVSLNSKADRELARSTTDAPTLRCLDTIHRPNSLIKTQSDPMGIINYRLRTPLQEV